MPWTTGQRLQGGKYVIEKVLGQGGFGITYKALDVELQRTVVIKTPNEYLSHDPDYDKYIERFIQEGRTLARLSQDPHPHIVGVIELFKEGLIHCLVMNFVPGENLFEVVRRRGALPESEILPCICQIAEALMVVHQAGLVHRDAHPGNIMLRSNGKAVLIDFGIAKELMPNSTSIAGHDGFAPYEQTTRGSREPTVDIYCLAATLYYAVTGQRPTTSLARRLDDVPLTQPKQIISGISDRLNQAILKGMAVEAKDRPQSMQAWLAMLEAPKATSPPPVDPVNRKEVVRSKAKLDSEAIPNKPATKPPRIVPWGWLVGVLLSYLLIACFLAAFKASSTVWIITGVGAVVGAVAWAWAGDVDGDRGGALVVAVLSAGACTTFAVGAGAVGVVVAWTVGGAGALVVALAGEKLQKSFSEVHTFLILASTPSLGLGLGWLGYRIIFNKGS